MAVLIVKNYLQIRFFKLLFHAKHSNVWMDTPPKRSNSDANHFLIPAFAALGQCQEKPKLLSWRDQSEEISKSSRKGTGGGLCLANRTLMGDSNPFKKSFLRNQRQDTR